MKKYDLSNWNMRSIKDMECAFIDNTVLENIVLGENCKLDACTSLKKTFNGCTKLKTDVGSLEPKVVTDLYGTFSKCSSLKKLSLNTWNVSNVETLYETFSECTNLQTLEIDKWQTGKVNNMVRTFIKCGSLTALDIGSWKTGKVTSMESTFESCSTITTLDIGGWDVSSVQNLSFTFKNCKALTALDIGSWKTGAVTTLQSTFELCTSIGEFNLDGWDVSNVKTLFDTFKNCDSATSISVKNWNVRNVTTLKETFNNCDKLLYIDFGTAWYLDNCTSMTDSFARCYSINQDFHEIHTTNKLTDVHSTFKGSNKIVKLDIRNINVSSVTDFDQAFCQDLSTGPNPMLKEIDIRGWDFSNAKKIYRMFYECRALERIYATNDIDGSKLTSKNEVFKNDNKIVGGNNTPYSGESYTFAKVDREGVRGYFTLEKPE